MVRLHLFLYQVFFNSLHSRCRSKLCKCISPFFLRFRQVPPPLHHPGTRARFHSRPSHEEMTPRMCAPSPSSHGKPAGRRRGTEIDPRTSGHTRPREFHAGILVGRQAKAIRSAGWLCTIHNTYSSNGRSRVDSLGRSREACEGGSERCSWEGGGYFGRCS